MVLNLMLRPASAGTLLVLAGGCVAPSPAGNNGLLAPSPRPYEADLPVPIGFALADQSSEDWSDGSIRYLRHRYVGRADKQSVRAFYRRQMPLVRWTAISDNLVPGRITMRFERADEACTVTIEDEGAVFTAGRPPRGGRVAVEAVITPQRRRETGGCQ